MGDLTLEQVAEEAMRCKLHAWEKISMIEQELRHGEVRMDLIEASISDVRGDLKKHEIQRLSHHAELRAEVKEVKSLVIGHVKEEMGKLDDLVNAITELTKAVSKAQLETDENTAKLNTYESNKRDERIIKEAMDEHFKDFREYKKKAIMTVVGIASTGLTIYLWEAITK